MKMGRAFVFIWVCLLAAVRLSAEESQSRFRFDTEIDPYYLSEGLSISFTTAPVPHAGVKSELEIYSELLKKFYMPREMILEASINPLPCSAALVKRYGREFYNSGKVTDNLNIIHSVTAGFEEPWAASLFLGNVMEFDPGRTAFRRERSSMSGKRHGYSGFVVSAGNFHIKDDVLIPDAWLETECKLKGEQISDDRTLKWSFRFGSKIHQNSEIADIFYVGVKRDIANFSGAGSFFLNNSGFEYVFDMSQMDFNGIRHFFLLDKKMPLARYRVAGKLSLGFVWTSGNKYTGSLSDSAEKRADPYQVIIRPNIVF